MIKHVTLINFTDAATDDQKQAVLSVFRSLPAHIPGIRDFSAGLDLGLLAGNAGLMVQASFDNESDFMTYSAHPFHMDAVYPVCGPVMAGYSTAQIQA